MNQIVYTEEKRFTKEQVQKLFLSVGWVSGEYPERLYKALMHSSTVITAWDAERLVGLVRLLDDTEMTAYMHYVLVDPQYHGQGIAGHMIEMVKEKLKSCRRKVKMRLFIRDSALRRCRTVWQCKFVIQEKSDNDKKSSCYKNSCSCEICIYLFSFFLRAADAMMSTQVSSPR